MKTHIVTINEVENLLQKLEMKLTSQMDKEIAVRVKQEVNRIEREKQEEEDTILP